jgi:hypothetical protein
MLVSVGFEGILHSKRSILKTVFIFLPLLECALNAGTHNTLWKDFGLRASLSIHNNYSVINFMFLSDLEVLLRTMRGQR